MNIGQQTVAGPRIAVIGAGAIGGYTGGLIAEAGYDVTFIDAWPENVAALRDQGLYIDEINQPEKTLKGLKALHIGDVQSLSTTPPFDIVLLSVKSYDTAWATTMIAPFLAPDGYVVSVQNCINEETIANIIGWGRTAGCSVTFSCEMYGPAQIRRTVGRTWTTTSAYYLGEVHGRNTRRITQLQEIFSTIDKTVITNNLWGERWSKLCINVMRNALSAVTGLGGNDREKNDIVRRYSIGVGGEAAVVGRALGFDFDNVGRLNADDLIAAYRDDATAFDQVSETLLSEAATSTRSDLQRPSMAQDIFKGRRTEVDWINGFVAERARSIGLSAPLNAELTRIVHQVVARDLAPDPANVPDIAKRNARSVEALQAE